MKGFKDKLKLANTQIAIHKLLTLPYLTSDTDVPGVGTGRTDKVSTITLSQVSLIADAPQ